MKLKNELAGSLKMTYDSDKENLINEIISGGIQL